MIKPYTRIVLSIFLFLALLASGLYGLAKITNRIATENNVNRLPVSSEIINSAIHYDPVLIAKIKIAAASLDNSQRQLFISGHISFIDNRDSLEFIVPELYDYEKDKDDVYLRIGSSELYHYGGLTLSIDNETRKIIVSKQQNASQINTLLDAKHLIDNLQGEGYELVGKVNDSQETLSLKNEDHISCKEIAITYDFSKNRPVSSMVRLAGPEDESGSLTDKILRLSIRKYSNSFKPKHLSKPVMIKNGSDLVAEGKYKDYEIINMINN